MPTVMARHVTASALSQRASAMRAASPHARASQREGAAAVSGCERLRSCARRNSISSASSQGLTLVYISAQHEPFLTQNTPYVQQNPATPPTRPLYNPEVHPLCHIKRLR